MDWNRMRDQIGWALTGVESYEHREARLSEDTPERILQDLIKELRGYADEGYIMGASTMRELCTRVKEDLREVSGD